MGYLGYDLCNAPADNPGRIALDMLIPRNGIVNEQCTMFIPHTGKMEEK